MSKNEEFKTVVSLESEVVNLNCDSDCYTEINSSSTEFKAAAAESEMINSEFTTLCFFSIDRQPDNNYPSETEAGAVLESTNSEHDTSCGTIKFHSENTYSIGTAGLKIGDLEKTNLNTGINCYSPESSLNYIYLTLLEKKKRCVVVPVFVRLIHTSFSNFGCSTWVTLVQNGQ